MSVWTHVVATYRVDALRAFGHGELSEDDFDRMFGKSFPEFKYYTLHTNPKNELARRTYIRLGDEYREHPERFAPWGSEGGLQRSIYTSPDTSNVAAYCVTYFGDLRDYDDCPAIKRWFDKCCQNSMIRQAVCQVVVENKEAYTYDYYRS